MSTISPIIVMESLFIVAPVVVVPLAINIAGQTFRKMAWYIHPVAALCVSVSLCVERGWAAGLLAAVWCTYCVYVGVCGLVRLRRASVSMVTMCEVAACLYLPIGGVGIVASRFSGVLLGFVEPIVFLTAVHFHFAGFATPLLVGASAALLPQSPVTRNIYRCIASAISIGPALVAIGFFISPLARMLAVVFYGTALTGFALLCLCSSLSLGGRLAYSLFRISNFSIIVGMMLAARYAIGEWTGNVFGLETMILWHGTLNSLGFILCGLLALTLKKSCAS